MVIIGNDQMLSTCMWLSQEWARRAFISTNIWLAFWKFLYACLILLATKQWAHRSFYVIRINQIDNLQYSSSDKIHRDYLSVAAYGMSETAGITHCTLGRDCPLASVGRVIPGVECKVGPGGQLQYKDRLSGYKDPIWCPLYIEMPSAVFTYWPPE